MKFRKYYKIGANKVELEVKDTSRISSDCDGGLAVWEQNYMAIGSNLPEDRQAVAFLHEVLHIMNVYLTEEQATYLSDGLMQVIRDNKINFLPDETNTQTKSSKS